MCLSLELERAVGTLKGANLIVHHARVANEAVTKRERRGATVTFERLELLMDGAHMLVEIRRRREA